MNAPKAPPVRNHSTGADLVISPGLSVHLYGKVVGLYSSRIDAGNGFVELPTEDRLQIVRFFNDNAHLLGSD